MIETIKIEVVYPFPPERVWRALTEPTALAEWLMPTADFAPQRGHKFQFRWKPTADWRGIVDCEVIELEAPRRLAYTWRGELNQPATLVTWTLEPVGGGTRLRLEHTGFDSTMQQAAAGAQHGWRRMLEAQLPQVLAQLDAPRRKPATSETLTTSATDE